MPPLIGESQNIGYLTPCSERGMTRLSSKMDLYGTHEDFLKMRGTPKASQLGHVLWRNQWFWGSPPWLGDDTSKINHGSIIHITSLHMSIDMALSENKGTSKFWRFVLSFPIAVFDGHWGPIPHLQAHPKEI